MSKKIPEKDAFYNLNQPNADTFFDLRWFSISKSVEILKSYIDTSKESPITHRLKVDF